MKSKLDGFKIAILVENGFEQSEMTEPKKALEDFGAETIVISPVKEKVRGWRDKNWGDAFVVDLDLTQAKADDFDALLLPGGVMNPDMLRINSSAINFIRSFVSSHKPIAAICHGIWPLIEANGVKGKTLTSWPSVKTDLINAGAKWVDKEVVQDDHLITSRKPSDIPAFNKAFIELLSHIHIMR